MLAAALVVAVAVAALPRLGWLLAAAGGVAVAGEPGAARRRMLAASPLLLPRARARCGRSPPPRRCSAWPASPARIPAIAGAARGAWTRAALGAAGLWWLLLAEPLLGRDLALGTRGDAGDVPGRSARAALLLAPLWALAALVLPWLVPGRALAVDVVGAGGLGGRAGRRDRPPWRISAGLAEPRGLAAGAVVAGALALILAARARNTVNAEDDRA